VWRPARGWQAEAAHLLGLKQITRDFVSGRILPPPNFRSLTQLTSPPCSQRREMRVPPGNMDVSKLNCPLVFHRDADKDPQKLRDDIKKNMVLRVAMR